MWHWQYTVFLSIAKKNRKMNVVPEWSTLQEHSTAYTHYSFPTQGQMKRRSETMGNTGFYAAVSRHLKHYILLQYCVVVEMYSVHWLRTFDKSQHPGHSCEHGCNGKPARGLPFETCAEESPPPGPWTAEQLVTLMRSYSRILSKYQTPYAICWRRPEPQGVLTLYSNKKREKYSATIRSWVYGERRFAQCQ